LLTRPEAAFHRIRRLQVVGVAGDPQTPRFQLLGDLEPMIVHVAPLVGPPGHQQR